MKTALLFVLAVATLIAPTATQAQAIPPEALAIARNTYVPVETFPVANRVEGVQNETSEGNKDSARQKPGSVSSGIQLPGGLVLTVAHAMVIRQDLRASREAKEAEVVAVWPAMDLMLLQTTRPGSTNFKLADAEVGETVFTYSNAGAENEFLSTYTVAKVEGDVLYVDRNLFPGSSGSGIWNNEGELVGVVNGDRILGSREYNVGYGIATRSRVVAEFLSTRYRPTAQVVMDCRPSEPPGPNAKKPNANTKNKKKNS